MYNVCKCWIIYAGYVIFISSSLFIIIILFKSQEHVALSYNVMFYKNFFIGIDIDKYDNILILNISKDD